MLFNKKGLLGINARNLLYIRPYNRKKAIKLADDKIKTKQFLAARDIPVPKLYGIIKNHKELEKFDFQSLPSSFVLKPNFGFGGEGIIVITSKQENHWMTVSGKKITKEDLVDHINDILDGRFSISNVGDSAFFEQYIVTDDKIGKYSFEGLPDIRVVVHNLIPVMAMLRLPTRESGGKANLHQGGVIVGIDIAKGETTFAAKHNKIIEELPDGLGKIRGIKIPYWDDILLISSKIQLITNLGYLAVDICLDKNSGPVLLEINARAGLGLQIANLAPLRKRLERIEGIKVSSPTKGVRIAKDMFGNIVEKEIENISGKQIINIEEEIEIIRKKGGPFKVKAKIDTGEERSIIDEKLAERKGLLDNTENYEDEKSTLKLKFSLKNQRIQTIVDVEKIPKGKAQFIIGKRDLKNFLVDSNYEEIKTPLKMAHKKQEIPLKDKSSNYFEIDQKITQIDDKIKLLYHLRPTNLESEKEKFLKNVKTNPSFEYPQLKFDPLELTEKLNKIKTDETPLGILFEAKKEEINKKIQLLESINETRFTEISKSLFGEPSEEDVLECHQYLKTFDFKKENQEEAIYNAEEAKKKFEKVFKHYKLKNWKVKIKETMVANCVAGKNNRLFVKKDAKFSRERLESLIVHEIETHILTAENGKNQPYEIFNKGLANYLITQEGLALYNTIKQRHIPFEKNYKTMGNVIGIAKSLETNFVETFEALLEYGYSIEDAFRTTLKAKRGFEDTSQKGAFTKDYLYFNGYKTIENFIENGGELKDLYLGKFNSNDLSIIKNIPNLNPPKYLPEWI
jgi:alpha-L-glutamate ligase-like protein/uncharacterized protein (TIGR02421 family)